MTGKKAMGSEFDSQITFFYTKNLAATTRFYEDTLGLPLILDQGSCRIYRTSPGACIGFCQRVETGTPDGVILTLVTRYVDEWYGRLVSRGVEFDAAPRFNPDYDIYHCFLYDPNGYKLEIQRFEDPRWKN